MESRGLPRHNRRRVSGWAQYPVAATALCRPEDRQGLGALVRDGGHLIARGMGASYGDASFSSTGRTVLTTRFDRFLDFDPESGIVCCEAGVTMADLLRVMVPRGCFPPVTPGTKSVTLGGCLAADVHGKNHHRDGAISAHVVDLHLLTADGSLVRCSRTERAELFWATVGGMGLTGIITELRLRLKRIASPWLRVDTERAADLDALLRGFEEDDQYAYSVAWLDGLARGLSLGRGVLMRGNDAPADPEVQRPRGKRVRPDSGTLTVPPLIPSGLLNPATVGAFNALYHRGAPRKRRQELVHYDPYFYPLDRLKHWYRLYGRRGFIQYQCIVPEAGGREALVQILETLTRHRVAPFLAVLKRFGAADTAQLLSFPKPGLTLALDIPLGADGVPPVVRRLDELVAARGGRVYLAKDACLAPEHFRAMYPEYEAWRAIKRAVDPGNRFRSDLADRLGLQG